jgi:colicin import membrane protein
LPEVIGTVRARAAALLVALGMVLGTSGLARAQSCPSSCDLACQTCCSQWKLRATCAGGDSSDDAAVFASFDEAQRAADARKQCAPGDAACEKARTVCSGATAPATWAPACDAKDRLAPPSDTDTSNVLRSSGAALKAARESTDRTSAELETFARTRSVRDRAVARAAAGVDGVRASRERLAILLREHERLTAGASAADARAFTERASAATKTAADAVANAKAIMLDPTVVDAAAEERERRLAAVLRAREQDEASRKAAREADEAKRRAAREADEANRKAAREAAVAEAQRRTQEADQRRKDAEVARVAAAEAAERKMAEQRAQQSATASASSAEKKALAEQKHGAVVKGLGDVDVQISAALAGVASGLAIANLSGEARARGQRDEQRLKALQERARGIRTRADAALQRPPADGLYAVSRAEVELAALAAEARASTPAAPASAIATKGSKEPVAVPACVIDIVPPAGLAGATVSLDGGKPVALPTKVRVSSGRHALVVAQGATTSRQSALVVCGRAQSLAVNPLK